MLSGPDRLPLSDLTRELRRLYRQPVDYNTVWRAVARGDLPAKRIGGRWVVSEADIPRIAEALGLSAPIAA